MLIVADEWETTCEVLGQLRNDLGRPPVYEGPYRYVWVVDFPLFVGVDKETGRPKPGHHPFCMPHPDDLDRLETDPMSVRALAYDLVLNGWELGSGSIRIHEQRPAAPGVQRCSASATRRPTASSASSSARSATARRPTAASPSASTGWWRSSPARRTSAR